MSQIVDLDVWVAGAAPLPDLRGELDADIEAQGLIPPLPVDRRRRPLPSGRCNDRYIGERF